MKGKADIVDPGGEWRDDPYWADYKPWKVVHSQPVPVPWARELYGVPLDHVTLPGPVAGISPEAAIVTAQVAAVLIVLEKAGGVV